jgi:hypothetical protein
VIGNNERKKERKKERRKERKNYKVYKINFGTAKEVFAKFIYFLTQNFTKKNRYL